MKKFLSILLVVMLVLSMIPATVSAATDKTLSFANTSNRTAFSTTEQKWEQNGITFINNKASSSSNVANYSNPVRLYANSKIIVECDNMAQIVFDCNSTTYANAMKTSIGTVSGATVTVASDKVTVTFSTAQDSFTVAKLSAQVRLDSLTVTIAEGACDHAADKLGEKITPEKPATCTEEGKKAIYLCACGEQVGGDKIPATNHAGKYETAAGVTATCKTEGKNATYYCPACEETIGGENIGLGEHDYVDGACTVCGESQPIIFELGTSTTGAHYDGSEKAAYSETVNGYTLNITGGTKMYTGARDEKSNSCIKLGTGSAVGGFSFAVPDDVYQVKIYIAGYKANNATVTINGKDYTITTHSNDGIYTEIALDTADVKNVTLTTKTTPDERAMVNSIEFILGETKPIKANGGKGFDTVEDALSVGYTVLKATDGTALPLDVTLEATGNPRFISLGADEDGFYTYYNLDLKLTSVNISSSRNGMYFKGEVVCDEELAKAVTGYGVVMSLQELKEGIDEDAYAYTYTEASLAADTAIISAGVFNIFKEGNAYNADRGAAPIYAKVYLKIGDRVVAAEQEIKLSFQEALEKLNTKLGSNELTLNEYQLPALRTFAQKWNVILSGWGLTNITKIGSAE